MTDRQERRRGRHASIAGDAADEVVRSLVAQFSDPYAFVRELIQNALDATASRVELRMRWDGEVVTLEVVDDGEGMDRATIEGYLLVKFRSTKDRDLTKIGKFGIGFVSVFAVEPRRVVVDTGRDSFWHRVTFGPDLRYELREMPDPFEGTTVTVEIPARGKAAAADVCARVHDTAVTWCRFADGVVTTSARGVPGGWETRSIAAPFTVDAPVVLREEAEGFLAVLGPHPGAHPPIGYYNRGLTLWEGVSGVVPGVTFRVDSLHLEHTLTRDDVIQDDGARAVLDRVATLARTRLGDAVHRAAAEATTRAQLVALFAAIADPSPWPWRDDLSLPLANGRRITLGELRPSLLTRLWTDQPLFVGEGAEAARICDAGTPVLLGAPDDPHVAFVARATGRRARPFESTLRAIEPVPLTDTDRALLAALEARLGRTVVLGRHAAVAVRSAAPFTVERVSDAGDAVVLGADHPLLVELRHLPTAQAAPIALRAVWLSLGVGTDAGDEVRELLDEVCR